MLTSAPKAVIYINPRDKDGELNSSVRITQQRRSEQEAACREWCRERQVRPIGIHREYVRSYSDPKFSDGLSRLEGTIVGAERGDLIYDAMVVASRSVACPTSWPEVEQALARVGTTIFFADEPCTEEEMEARIAASLASSLHPADIARRSGLLEPGGEPGVESTFRPADPARRRPRSGAPRPLVAPRPDPTSISLPVAASALIPTPETSMHDAIIYTRISFVDRVKKAEGRERAANERQDEVCERWAQSNNFLVIKRYEDNDVSAYNTKVVRPEFERMISDLAHGLIQARVLLVWKYDRLTRNFRDHARLRQLTEADVIQIVAVEGGVDTRNPTGRMIAAIMAEAAQFASDETHARVVAARDDELLKGRTPKSGRVFGHEKHWTRVVESEAAEIREAAAAYLAGDSLRSIATRWNERGIRTSRGGEWTYWQVRQMLSSARLCGCRERDGELYRTDEVQHQIAQIITRDVWERVQTRVRLDARQKVNRARAPRGISRLLTGRLVCGRCGCKRVTGNRRAQSSGGQRIYVCNQSHGGCGTSIRSDTSDAWITECVLNAIEGGLVTDLWHRLTDSEDSAMGELAARIERDEAWLVDWAKQSASSGMSPAEIVAGRTAVAQQLEARRSEWDRRIAEQASLVQLEPDHARHIRELWDEAELPWRRALLASVIDRIELAAYDRVKHPKGAHSPEAAGGRLNIIWRA